MENYPELIKILLTETHLFIDGSANLLAIMFGKSNSK